MSTWMKTKKQVKLNRFETSCNNAIITYQEWSARNGVNIDDVAMDTNDDNTYAIDEHALDNNSNSPSTEMKTAAPVEETVHQETEINNSSNNQAEVKQEKLVKKKTSLPAKEYDAISQMLALRLRQLEDDSMSAGVEFQGVKWKDLIAWFLEEEVNS